MLTEWMPCGGRAGESLGFCYMPRVPSLSQKNVEEIATTGFKLLLNRANLQHTSGFRNATVICK
jgi:hypothetical protein